MGTRVSDVRLRSADRRRSVRQLQPMWKPTDGRFAGRAGTRRWRMLRRLIALGLLLAAATVATWGAGADRGEIVIAVDADLPLGAVLDIDDLVLVRSTTPPDGALRQVDQAVGRRLAGAMRRGELLTDLRLIGATGPDPGPGRIAVAVRPDDPALIPLLQPGTAVAVVGIAEDGTPSPLSQDALVLAVLAVLPDADDRSPPVLLSVPSGDADRVTAATLTGDVALQFT